MKKHHALAATTAILALATTGCASASTGAWDGTGTITSKYIQPARAEYQLRPGTKDDIQVTSRPRCATITITDATGDNHRICATQDAYGGLNIGAHVDAQSIEKAQESTP